MSADFTRIVSARVTRRELALVDLAAQDARLPRATLIREILLPAVAKRVVQATSSCGRAPENRDTAA